MVEQDVRQLIGDVVLLAARRIDHHFELLLHLLLGDPALGLSDLALETLDLQLLVDARSFVKFHLLRVQGKFLLNVIVILRRLKLLKNESLLGNKCVKLLTLLFVLFDLLCENPAGVTNAFADRVKE